MRVFAAVISVTAAAPLRDMANYSFETYCQEFDKNYNSEEHGFRRGLVEAKLEKNRQQNAEYVLGRSSWYAAINHFADWTEEELSTLRTGKRSFSAGPHLQAPKFNNSVRNPSRIDWREKGKATEVRDQGNCGCCWAFGSTAVLESHAAIASGTSPHVLAPQAYVNCAPNPDDCGSGGPAGGGCDGGAIPETAFKWSATHGLPLEADLPYKQKDGTCKPYKAAVHHSGYVKLPPNNAHSLETAIATIGPMAVNVASNWPHNYGGGVFSGGCRRKHSHLPADECDLDHIVAVYGYGVLKGEGYWLVRNSWNKWWGEHGYIRLSRSNDHKTYTDRSPGDGTACKPYPKTQSVMGESGILFDISYPTGVRTASDAAVAV